jgi:hypothetical protein
MGSSEPSDLPRDSVQEKRHRTLSRQDPIGHGVGAASTVGPSTDRQDIRAIAVDDRRVVRQGMEREAQLEALGQR